METSNCLKTIALGQLIIFSVVRFIVGLLIIQNEQMTLLLQSFLAGIKLVNMTGNSQDSASKNHEPIQLMKPAVNLHIVTWIVFCQIDKMIKMAYWIKWNSTRWEELKKNGCLIPSGLGVAFFTLGTIFVLKGWLDGIPNLTVAGIALYVIANAFDLFLIIFLIRCGSQRWKEIFKTLLESFRDVYLVLHICGNIIVPVACCMDSNTTQTLAAVGGMMLGLIGDVLAFLYGLITCMIDYMQRE